VDLDRVVDDLLEDVRRDDLDGRDLGHRGERAHLVHLPRGVERQEPRLVDGDARVGDALAVAAEAEQRLPERGPAHAAVDHELERALGGADAPHAVVDAARAEPPCAISKPRPGPR
jgi:hypothetical protein